jgi:DNA-nicking Smr family endonuclease
MSQMKIFQLKNDKLDLIDTYLDLHGLQKVEALNIVKVRLLQISQDLKCGKIIPLIGDGRNHIVKIVCGKGIHSKGKAVLKYAIPKFLVRFLHKYLFFRRRIIMIFTVMNTMA